ncbi:MAG: alpha/beta hydrolase [Elainellaceae cyanobacterium]
MTCSPNGFSIQIRSWIEKIARSRIPRPHWINLAVGVGMTPAILAGGSAVAADYVRVQFGPVELSISIDSLETFVTEGTVEDDLAAYARRLNDERLSEIRQLLVTPADLDAIALSNFLYTRQGEILLERLGNIVRTESNSGFYALRAALILSATSADGLTPLNVLQQFPTSSIVIDVERALAIVRELERLINTTSEAIALVENQFESNIGSNSPGIDPTTDFSDLGPLRWQEQTFNLNDQGRDRSFQVDLYVPNISEQAPVIVISHGLGSDRTSFSYLAQHLASYGFAVIAPEHPGSNAEYIQALFTGAATQVADPSEFVDRALDVKYTLDELERRSRAESQLQGRLDLDNVGVIGQSFGGYTALALAGATINFQQLEQDCPQGDVQEDTLNLSLLLQCRALGLDSPIPNLKEDRVKSVIAINPIGSTVFGKKGFETIDVPVMLVSGSADIVAPTLIEQILPFSWLQVPNKYLLLIQNSTHFSTIGRSSESSETLLLPPEIIGPQPQLAQQYVEALSVTFFRAFVTDQSQYQAYLTPAYINRISQAPLPLNLVQTINSEQLTRVLKQNALVLSASREQRSRVRRARFD